MGHLCFTYIFEQTLIYLVLGKADIIGVLRRNKCVCRSLPDLCKRSIGGVICKWC